MKTERFEVRIATELKERLRQRAATRGVDLTHQAIEYLLRGLDEDEAREAQVSAMRAMGEEQV